MNYLSITGGPPDDRIALADGVLELPLSGENSDVLANVALTSVEEGSELKPSSKWSEL